MRRRDTEAGFSLVELAVGLGLSLVVLASILGVFSTLSRTCTRQNTTAAVQQTARLGLDAMVREIRMAGLDPLGTAGAGIEEIDPAGNKLRLSVDRCDRPAGGAGCRRPTPNGSLGDHSERVTFFLDLPAGRLRRCLYEPPQTVLPAGVAPAASCQTLVDGVVPNPGGRPLFEFLDDSAGGPRPITRNGQRHRIRTVRITLTVALPAGAQGAVGRTYTARVRCRNLGL